MSEILFIPEYNLKRRLAPFVVIPFAFFLILQVVSGANRNIEVVIGAVFMSLLTVFLPFLFIKWIIFSAQGFALERFFAPKKIIKYVDVNDFSGNIIKTKSGNIEIRMMTNSGELFKIFTQLIEQGKISRDQIENKLVAQEKMTVGSFLLSAFIALGLKIFVDYIWPYEKSFLRDMSFFGFLFLIYFIIYQISKIRSENK